MKQLIIFLFFILIFPNRSIDAQEKKSLPDNKIEAKIDVLEDRINALEKNLNIRIDALDTKLSAKIDAVDTKLNSKIDAIETKFDTRFEFLFWIQGIVIALILFMLGYIIWDRRTALKPALDKALSADEKSSRLLRAIREYAQKHPELENILRTHGLL